MTDDEKRDLLILGALIKIGSDTTMEKLNNEVKPALEGAELIIIDDMAKRGLLVNFKTDAWQMTSLGLRITEPGRAKYTFLKRKKRIQPIMAIAFWTTLIAAVVAAIYAVMGYHFPHHAQLQSLPSIQRIPASVTAPLEAKKITSVTVDDCVIKQNFY